MKLATETLTLSRQLVQAKVTKQGHLASHPQRRDMTLMPLINRYIRTHMKTIEMTAVLMRIGSFSLVSWQGTHSPFMLVWIVNTLDAIGLSWCAVLKRDKAYTLLNVFWVVIGIIGILRAAGWLH